MPLLDYIRAFFERMTLLVAFLFFIIAVGAGMLSSYYSRTSKRSEKLWPNMKA